MNNCIEQAAKTVDEAINLALKQLKVDRSMVDIEVIDEGNKGFFGIIGNKQARIKVTLKEDENLNKVKNFVSDIMQKMGVEGCVEGTETGEEINIKISGDDVGILIGRRGETLDALQYITSLVMNKGARAHCKIMIDVESYRCRREETLIALAERLAKKVIRTRKSLTLEPMTAYERRIIHSSLQTNTSVDTYSIGEEPYRKIVIKPK
jgi:spoIIIJ-associated protein